MPSLAHQVYHAAHLTGTFLLRSGATSSEYFDKYRFESNPILLKNIAEQLSTKISGPYDALAGLEMGGIPLATMLAQFTGLPTLFIRKTAKEYGTCRYAEGGEVKGKRLLIVEDVVTSGGAILDAVSALRNDGAIIDDVICVIDRQSGGRGNLAKENLTMTSLFTMEELKTAQ